jgi:hypothetical protein
MGYMESKEGLPSVQEFEENIKVGLEIIVDEAKELEIEIPVDINTLGFGERNTEGCSQQEKASLGKVVWEYFDMPKGNLLMDSLVQENNLQTDAKATVPGNIRERVFRTGQEGVLLHELLFVDGQKRFTVSAE